MTKASIAPYRYRSASGWEDRGAVTVKDYSVYLDLCDLPSSLGGEWNPSANSGRVFFSTVEQAANAVFQVSPRARRTEV